MLALLETVVRRRAPQGKSFGIAGLNLIETARLGMRSLLSDLPISVQFMAGLRTSATMDDDVAYAIDLARHYIRIIDNFGLDLRNARVLELGPGLDFGPQLILASHGARVIVADRFLAKWNRHYHPEFYLRLKARWNGPCGAINSVLDAGWYSPNVMACLAEPAETLSSVPSGSCDIVLSNAVLEHVYDLPAVCRSLARVTKPGGFGSHQIDLRDHRNFARPLEFLLDDEVTYRRRLSRGRVSRGNRRRLGECVAHFRDCGFRIEQVEPNGFADKLYLEGFIPRLRRSRSPYRNLALEDLAVTGARINMRR